MLMRRFPQGSGYNFPRQHVICFATFSSQQVRRRLQTLSAAARIRVRP